MKFIKFGFIFNLVFSFCWSNSTLTINDYYNTSENTVVVWPSIGLKDIKSIPSDIQKFTKTLSQWGNVQSVRDEEFNINEYLQQVIYIIGTEKTNFFLQRNANQLLPHTAGGRIHLLDKSWPENGSSLLSLNRFNDRTTLILYTDSTENVARVFDVSHGMTSFLVFNDLCMITSPEDYLARGNLEKIDGKWSITDYSAKQIIPHQYVVSAIGGDFGLSVGDIILKYANKDIYTYNLSYILNEPEDVETQLIFSRAGEIMQQEIKPSTLFGGDYSFVQVASTVPLLTGQSIKEGLNNYVELMERAWVDTWNLIGSPKWGEMKAKYLNQTDEAQQDLVDVWVILNKLISDMNDGHVYANLNEIMPFLIRKMLDVNAFLFPFQPLISGGKMYVPENDLGLPKGAQIMAVNGEFGGKLIKNMAGLCSGDCLEHKITDFDTKNFSLWLYLLNGGNKKYKLLLYDDDRRFFVTVNGRSYFQIENSLTISDAGTIEIAPEVLLLTLHSFDNSTIPFIEEALTKLQTGNYKSFVLDLRNNGGGSTMVADTLLKGLMLKPYRYYKATRNRRSLEAEKDGMEFEPDVAYGQRDFWSVVSEVKNNENAFKGDIYVLTSPKTFSAAFDVSLVLQQHRGAKLVGGSPGGLFIQTGNHFTANLFDYGLHTSVPYKDFLSNQDYFADYDSTPRSAQLIPDYEIFYTSSLIKQNIDPQMNFLLELLKKP